MKKESTMVRISKEHLAKLQKLAKMDNRSATKYLERMIDQKYKKIMEDESAACDWDSPVDVFEYEF